MLSESACSSPSPCSSNAPQPPPPLKSHARSPLLFAAAATAADEETQREFEQLVFAYKEHLHLMKRSLITVSMARGSPT